MAEILETLGSNGQLGKALYELLEQVATSAVLKANEKDKNASSSMVKGQPLPLCKSIPISSRDSTQYIEVCMYVSKTLFNDGSPISKCWFPWRAS